MCLNCIELSPPGETAWEHTYAGYSTESHPPRELPFHQSKAFEIDDPSPDTLENHRGRMIRDTERYLNDATSQSWQRLHRAHAKEMARVLQELIAPPAAFAASTGH